ncbi:hypothetical protein R3P38DRAFT_2573975, partial [Favolaschia claudopus]
MSDSEQYWEDAYDLDEMENKTAGMRLPPNVAQFFDLEAIAEGEDEHEELQPEEQGTMKLHFGLILYSLHTDFIDDEDVGDADFSPRRKSALADQEGEQLAELAESIRRRYSKRAVLPDSQERDSTLPLLEYLPFPTDIPLYAIRVFRGKEDSVLRFLFAAATESRCSFASAFIRDDLPGKIYVETAAPQQLMSLASQLSTVGRLRLVPLSERAALLDLRHIPQPLRLG